MGKENPNEILPEIIKLTAEHTYRQKTADESKVESKIDAKKDTAVEEILKIATDRGVGDMSVHKLLDSLLRKRLEILVNVRRDHLDPLRELGEMFAHLAKFIPAKVTASLAFACSLLRLRLMLRFLLFP